MSLAYTIQPRTTLRCDFNMVGAGDVVRCARQYAVIIWHPLDVGGLVEMEDGEGNRCNGTVVALRPNHQGEPDQMIDVKPHWETWKSAPPRSPGEMK